MARCNLCNQNNNPIVTPPVDCPTPIRCDEIMDALCVLYTGDKINLCLTNEVVINRLDNLSEILQILVDKICSLEQKSFVTVEIMHNNSGAPFPTLVSQVTGGVGPYTYQWRAANNIGFSDNAFISSSTVMGGHRVIGSKTNPSINLDSINIMGIESKYFMDNIKHSYVELIVTDSLGNKGNAYYNYTSSCYETVPVASTPRPAFLGDNLRTNTGYPGATWKFPTLDFCDLYSNMTTCDDLKNLYCVPGYEWGSDVDTLYRGEYNTYLLSLDQNFGASRTGTPVSQLIDLEPQIDSIKNLTSLLGFRPDGFMTFSNLESCPQCSKEAWTVITYNGDTLSEIFPSFTNPNCDFYWIEQSDVFPTVGQPGQLFNNTNYPGDTYAWNPSADSWDLGLGSLIVDNFLSDTNQLGNLLTNEYKRKLNEFMQAHLPLVQANLYAPLHRWKYDVIDYNACNCGRQ
jgi:hypothetical protein